MATNLVRSCERHNDARMGEYCADHQLQWGSAKEASWDHPLCRTLVCRSPQATVVDASLTDTTSSASVCRFVPRASKCHSVSSVCEKKLLD